jgi:hypothetical protein
LLCPRRERAGQAGDPFLIALADPLEDLRASRLVVDALDAALDEREHQVLRTQVRVFEGVGLLLRLDEQRASLVVEAGNEEPPVAAAMTAAPTASAPRRPAGRSGRPVDDLVDALV